MTSSRRVLFLMDNVGIGGGTETMAVTILAALRTLGFDVSIAVLYRPTFPTFNRQLRDMGVSVHEFDVPAWGVVGRPAIELARLQRQLRFDLIHARRPLAAMTLCIAKPFLRSAATVVSFHAIEFPEDRPRTLRGESRKRVFAAAMRHIPDGLVGNSTAVSRHHEKHLGLSNVKTVPNGVDLSVLDDVWDGERLDLHARYSIPREAAIGVLPARLEDVKGHTFLLQALERYTGPRVHLLFLGEGTLERALKDESQARKLERVVTFCGLVERRESLAHVAAADFVVLPSKSEGFPMTVLEAMALRRAVVASAVGGVVDVIEPGKNGLLFEARDPDGIAEGIATLVRDPDLRRRLGEDARRKVEAKYSLAVVAQRWGGLYDELIAARR